MFEIATFLHLRLSSGWYMVWVFLPFAVFRTRKFELSLATDQCNFDCSIIIASWQEELGAWRMLAIKQLQCDLPNNTSSLQPRQDEREQRGHGVGEKKKPMAWRALGQEES